MSERKTFVVFGGTGSVGKNLAEKLTESGHNVVIGARDVEKANSIAEPIGARVFQASAEDIRGFDAGLKFADTEFGAVDGVANCIGSVLLKPAHLTTDAEWDSVIATNLTSAFAVVRSAAKAMRKNGGSVVLVSSAAAEIGLSNHEAIAAAKAGIVGLTRSAAATYAPRGIRFNAVSPGLVKSEMTRRLWETDEAAAMSAQMHALGRLGEPGEIAEAIKWLLLPTSGWVTGQSIGVDGGLASVLTRMKV